MERRVLPFFTTLFLFNLFSFNSLASSQLHLIYSTYSPGYLGLLKREDWKEATIGYLSKLWGQIKDDPNPALLLTFGEKGAPGVREGDASSEQILEIVKGCEERGINFLLQIAGPSPPLVTLSTCEKVFKIAPRTCKGIYLSEPLNAGHGWDYINDLISFRNLCKKYKRKMVWAEHSRDGTKGMGWWGFSMVDTDGWAKLFDKNYSDVIVPLHETNDPRVETLNLGACLGMWLGGLAKEWGFSAQDWWWHDAGYGEHYTCPPDVIFRMCLQAVSLGATYIQFEHMQMIWEWGTWSLARIYREGIKPFIELYKGGKIRIPARDEILSFSPIAIKLLKQGRSIALFESCPWLKETPDVYIPHYFYNERRYQDGLIPETPYGILVLFPTNALVPQKRFAHVLESDGSQIYYGKKSFSPSDARSLLLSLAEGSPLPLKVEGAYGVLTKTGRKNFLIWLINSVEKEPPRIDVSFRISLGHKEYSLYDRETGELIGKMRDGEKVSVPLAIYRLIEVRAK